MFKWHRKLEMVQNHELSTGCLAKNGTSGIESQANKGTAGIKYFNDSFFTQDLVIWRKHFNC
jgi:hypothetical protein